MKRIIAAVLLVVFAAATVMAAFAAEGALYRGDLDRDGKVLAKEARIILRMSARLEPAPEAGSVDFYLADVDGDGRILAKDARAALRMSARLDPMAEFVPAEDVSGEEPTEPPVVPTEPPVIPTEPPVITTEQPALPDLPAPILALLDGKFKAEIDGSMLDELMGGDSGEGGIKSLFKDLKSIEMILDKGKFRVNMKFTSPDMMSLITTTKDDGTQSTKIYLVSGTNKMYYEGGAEDEMGLIDADAFNRSMRSCSPARSSRSAATARRSSRSRRTTPGRNSSCPATRSSAWRCTTRPGIR